MKPIRLGLLGCGTVGGGVGQLLRAKGEYISQSVGASLEVASVLVRDGSNDRVPELDRGLLTTDPEAVLGDPTIDVFIEVMGGVNPSRAYVERALDTKRSVGTANKMPLAKHGPPPVTPAIANDVDLPFQGSGAGGLPRIRGPRR